MAGAPAERRPSDAPGSVAVDGSDGLDGLLEITRRPRSRRCGLVIARLVVGLIGLAVVQIVRTEYPYGLLAGPLGRAPVVARANSIGSAADAKIAASRPSATATAMEGSAVALAGNEWSRQ